MRSLRRAASAITRWISTGPITPPFADSLTRDFQERSDLFDCRLCSDAMLLSQDRDRAMLDELIGPPDPNDRRGDSWLRTRCSMTAQPKPLCRTWSSNVQITSTLRAKNSRVPTSSGLIHRGLIKRDRNPFALQNFCRLLGEGKHVSQPNQCHLASVLDDFGLSDLQ